MNKATNIKQNFHLPLSPKLYAELKEQAQERGQPATELARDALESYLRQLRIQKIGAELEAYVDAVAGTRDDFDPDVAAAGADVICATPSGFEPIDVKPTKAKTKSKPGLHATR